MHTIEKLPSIISIGRQGESGIQSIEIDVSEWLSQWPDGTISATYMAPKSEDVHMIPPDYIALAGNILTITVRHGLTEEDGVGTITVRITEGADTEKRSATFGVHIEKGHKSSYSSIPSIARDFVSHANEVFQSVEEAVSSANTAITNANTAITNLEGIAPLWSSVDISVSALGEGAAPTASITQGETGTSISLGIPKGIQGLKGDTGNGIVSVLRTSGDGTPGTTDTYTITFDDDTTTTFPVYNGADAPALSGVKQYIIRWDKVNSQCTRMGDAAEITTTITNFCHRGSVNPSYANPFDSLYPWKYRKLCKVNRAAYAALPAGSPITDAVTMWEGEPGFALDGTGDFDGVYTPEFWGRTWQDDTYVYTGVADGPIPGWIHYEATIGGRYFGALDGNGKITSIGNSLPLRNTRMDTTHTNVTAQGMTLDDIWTWSADTLLMVVEYATLNSEIAIGKGVDDLYRQSSEKVGANASVGETVLKLPNAFVDACVPGALIGLGTTNGGEQTGVTWFISSADLDGADPLFATHKAVTVPALTVNVTTDTFICIHGAYNAPDAAIGSMSGYIGVNGKSNAYYRGRVSHGNFFRYCLGAYRQTGTGKIWVASSRGEAAATDALDTGVHRDTGLALPTANGYISELHLDNLLPMAPFAKATGGTAGSTNPVGDYCYVPSLETGNTILRLGGLAYSGALVGRFYGHWYYTASSSSWSFACLPYLKTP